ncbi:MAG TPA: 50S ribosomal protein L3 [Patescibacteria group bacterium]|nr:50S ribosomal protein L3 [Patescibacteria group bacterium]
MKALITRKVGMTSTINDDGVMQAITLLSATPNVVTQVKTDEKDGYMAVQVGAGEAKKLAKPQIGHYKAAKLSPAIAREFRIDELPEDLSVGTQIAADVFSVGDVVHVTGTSKGKGWAGTIKRHNFHRGRKTHGGGSYRRPGSIGSMYPQKIFKGKKMAGQMGDEQVTVRNLKVVIVDPELNVIGVAGAVPGPRKGIVIIKGTEQ